MTKKRNRFRRGYLIFLLILLVIVAASLTAVWLFLKNFQGQVESEGNVNEWLESQNAFEAYISRMTYSAWADMWYEANPDSFDSRGEVLESMEQVLADNTNYARGKNYTDEAPVYVIEGPSGTIAEFSMSKNSEGNWVVASSELKILGTESSTCKAPSGCIVKCNGVELDDSYCTEKVNVFPLSDKYGDDLNGAVAVCTWEVSGQLKTPVLEVISPDGYEIEEDGVDTPVLTASIQKNAGIRDKAKVFFDAFIKYGMYGYWDLERTADAAAKLCRKDSQAYEYIYTSMNAFSNAPCYSVYESDIKEGPMIKWADNAYSIDFEYDTVATYMGSEKYYFDGEYRIFVMDLGDGFEVCGIINQ